MESNTPNTPTPENNNQPATPQRQTMAPIFDEKQKEHVNRIIDKVTRKLEAKHREDLARVQQERDAAAKGELSESDLLVKLRVERDAAQQRLREMERARSESIAAAKFTRAWNDAGFADNPEWRESMRRVLTKLDDDGELVLLDLNGKERFGVDLPTLMQELGEQFPRLRPGAEDPANPSDASRNAPHGKYKSDFDRTGKVQFIQQHGLAKWEALPLSRPTNTDKHEDDVLTWDNEKKGAFIRKHGGEELGRRMAAARELRRNRTFKG